MTKKCLICGEEVHSNYPQAKYCSHECREAANKLKAASRHAEYRLRNPEKVEARRKAYRAKVKHDRQPV